MADYPQFTPHVIANFPNGDQTISVLAAGVVVLTPPDGSDKAIITNPVDVYIRFNAVPAANVGTLYPASSGIVLQSPSEIAECQIYVTAACTLFVQYER